jgi:uncharacterized membrane protein YqiK
MPLQMPSQLVLALIAIGALLLFGVLILIVRCWKQVVQGQAMIINKMRNEPQVTFTGAIVLPVIHKAEVMDLSVKTIEVERRGKEGLICADNIRADIKVTFFVRVNKTVDDVLRVAQSIGCARASQQRTLEELFIAKFSEALKTVGKKMEFEHLYTQRDLFKDQIIQVIGKDLNGYILDDAAIDFLEQTPIDVLDHQNVLDALGIKKITDITTNANIGTNELKQHERMELGRQNLTADEAIFRFEQQRAEAEAKKNKEISIAVARETNDAARFQVEEEKRTHIEQQRAEEAVQTAEQAKLRAVQVAEQGRVREVEVEKVRATKAHDLEEVLRQREVELGVIDKQKAIEGEKRAIADVVRTRVAVEKTVAVEEESIKDIRVDAEAKRQKQVAVVGAEAAAQALFIKDIKEAEAEQQVAQAHAKKQLILAEAAMEAADKEARAAIRKAEGDQAEHAAEGLAGVRVKEADAVAIEKRGLAEARVRDAHVAVTDREGVVIAENTKRKAFAEAAGREADATAVEKQGLAAATALREKLLAEVTAKEAEANAIGKRMAAEAQGLALKADAMKALEGTGREHEEYRLRLANEREIALSSIDARVRMTQEQAKVMGHAMERAHINIVGGDGQFFDRFVRAVSLGQSIDGVVDYSETVRKVFGDHLSGKANLVQDLKEAVASSGLSTEAVKNLSVTALLAKLMATADESKKGSIKALIDKAHQLGLGDK